MRLCISAIIMFVLLLYNTFTGSLNFQNTRSTSFNEAYNAYVTPPSKKLAQREEGLEIKGILPDLQNIDKLSTILKDSIKESIDITYRQKVAAAKESKARSITFDFDYYYSGGISSLVLKTRIITAVSKDEVNSFNYKPDENRMIGINDALGPNGIQIASKVISQLIRADSELYYANFSGLQDTDAFYITDDGKIVFLFNAFQIAPGSEGIVPFTLQIDGVKNSRAIKKGEDYWINNTSYSLKMIPLRAVCDDLGYRTHWDANNRETTVERKGDIIVSFRTNINKYTSSRPGVPDKTQARALESAPVIKDGVTYVPISFFDQILELVAYHVNDNESIIFSTYTED